MRSTVLLIGMLVRSSPPAAWMRCSSEKLPLKLPPAWERLWGRTAADCLWVEGLGGRVVWL